MLTAYISVLVSQGRSWLNYMAILSRRSAHAVKLSMIYLYYILFRSMYHLSIKFLFSRLGLFKWLFSVWRYLRDFEIETIGLKDTPRRCSDKNCGARLKDTVLDWDVSTCTFYMLSYKFFYRNISFGNRKYCEILPLANGSSMKHYRFSCYIVLWAVFFNFFITGK